MTVLRTCPKCGSHRTVEIAFTMREHCLDCGHVATFAEFINRAPAPMPPVPERERPKPVKRYWWQDHD